MEKVTVGPWLKTKAAMTASEDSNSRYARLMRSAQCGDRSAYAELLRDLAPRLRQMVRRRQPFPLQPQDVEDLVQDILLSLHTARGTYDPVRPFFPWLAAIVRNRMADAARRSVRRRDELSVAQLPETFSPDGANIVEDAFGDPEALRHAISALPGGQRQAVEMLKLRELSLREASAASGMSVGALKVAVHRGIRTLRMKLMKEG